jgi:hypothetical protein
LSSPDELAAGEHKATLLPGVTPVVLVSKHISTARMAERRLLSQKARHQALS